MSTAARRLFAGHRVRELRTQLGISQAAMAGKLGISISYLSQIENGDRPITPAVLSALARNFPDDWALVEPGEHDALLVEAMEAASDTSIADGLLPEEAVQRGVRQQPLLARRMVALHQELRHLQEQLRMLDDSVESGAGGAGRLPWEEIRDWFHAESNYIHPLDRGAEELAETLLDGDPARAIADRLQARFHVGITPIGDADSRLRAFDVESLQLRLDLSQPPETTLFSLAHQLVRLEFAQAMQEVIAGSGIESDASRQLLAAGLANYAAGALLMPYGKFRAAARELRHDIDRLRKRFGTSFEQTCHRLSNLQRPGARGIPFFFCRVDMAGNVTKRHSATRLQFARFGGACPLWVVHEAVAIPDRILVQLAETPDGVRYVSMAKGLVKPSGSYLRPQRRYAVALGCEERHAPDFIYADGLRTDGAATPIGTSCRICPRADCDQRAFPPAAGQLVIDPDRRGAVPYRVR
jgi:predicted transcriptional regulator/DNA-binding XRE family transcriptional regulator